MPQAGRAGLILSIPVKQVSLGSPRVGTIHVQAPTPHAPPLQAFLADFSRHSNPFEHELLGNGFQSSQSPQESAHAVQATTHYQTYPERRPGADLPPKKVSNLDPMAARSRQKRQLPEGPQ